MLTTKYPIKSPMPIQIDDGKMSLKQVQYQDVKQFASKASRERVSISDTQNTLWFHIIYEAQVIGCCALYLAKKKIRIKGDWITQSYRGKGLGEFITNCRIEIARLLDYENIEVLTLHPKYYESKGFVINKEIRKGIWHADICLNLLNE